MKWRSVSEKQCRAIFGVKLNFFERTLVEQKSISRLLGCGLGLITHRTPPPRLPFCLILRPVCEGGLGSAHFKAADMHVVTSFGVCIFFFNF